jgi:hypothetical protein
LLENISVLFFQDFYQLLSMVTRWTNFRPHNSKQAPKNISWPGKIGGWEMANFVQNWQKPDTIEELKFFISEPKKSLALFKAGSSALCIAK